MTGSSLAKAFSRGLQTLGQELGGYYEDASWDLGARTTPLMYRSQTRAKNSERQGKGIKQVLETSRSYCWKAHIDESRKSFSSWAFM
jgi:hypothetical protein